MGIPLKPPVAEGTRRARRGNRRGPAGSGLWEATDRIAAERLEAAILGNIRNE
jgi:hypothetical protein